MWARGESLRVAALCALWYAASSATNVAAKLALAEFPFPVTVTLAQLLGAVLLGPVTLAACGVRPAPAYPRELYLRALLPLALAKVLTTLCSQVSLGRVPVSYAHTVKATTPLWTAALARLLYGESQPARVRWALATIAAGVALASATELRFDAGGLGAALAAAALLSLQQLRTKRAMRECGAHHLRLLLTLSRLALLLFVPVWLTVDARGVLAAGGPGAHGAVLLAASGALGWLQAALAFGVLSRVSPLGYAVASAAKRVVVVGASLVVLRNPAPPANLAGMLLAAAGVLAYNRARIATRPHQLLPV